MADLEVSIENKVAWLELNRPEKLNAVSNAMAAEMPRVCAELERDRWVHAVVITGRGRGFCSGADSGERLQTLVSDVDLYAAGQFVVAVHRVTKPVVAMVNGVAAGSGLALALAADIRVMAESAYFVPAFISRGLVPDSGLTATLVASLGYGMAAEMLLSNRKVSAQDALKTGLANRCVPLDDLRAETASVVSTVAGFDCDAVRTTKQLLRMAAQPTYPQQAELEAFAQHHYLQRANEGRGNGPSLQ